MAYRELLNVAMGVRGQIDACISALDLHEDAPDDLDVLINNLEAALNTCDSIIQKGTDEPEEDANTTSEEAAKPSGQPDEAAAERDQPPAAAEDPIALPPIF